jgi:hypothetical protein
MEQCCHYASWCQGVACISSHKRLDYFCSKICNQFTHAVTAPDSTNVAKLLPAAETKPQRQFYRQSGTRTEGKLHTTCKLHTACHTQSRTSAHGQDLHCTLCFSHNTSTLVTIVSRRRCRQWAIESVPAQSAYPTRCRSGKAVHKRHYANRGAIVQTDTQCRLSITQVYRKPALIPMHWLDATQAGNEGNHSPQSEEQTHKYKSTYRNIPCTSNYM